MNETNAALSFVSNDFAITYALSFLHELNAVQVDKLKKIFLNELERDEVFRALKLG